MAATAAVTPSVPAGPATFALRVGAVLTEPGRALRAVETRGNGVRDSIYLVLLGVVCLRLQDLARAALGASHLSLATVAQQMLNSLAREVNEAALVVIPAALLVTLLAGARRDAALDLELGATAFAPFFLVRALYRAADAIAGPLPGNRLLNWASLLVGGAWAAVVVLAAVRVARARITPVGKSGPPIEAHAAAALAPALGGRAPRIAASLAGAVLAVALVANLTWVVRHADAIRPMRRGTPAPDFSLPRIDGESGDLALASLRGKVVLLDFWATWCTPCVKMIPLLHALHHEWSPRGVEFLGVDSDGDGATYEEVRAFVAAHPAPYPTVLDDGRANGLYKVTGLPHMVVVGRDGSIESVFFGTTSKLELEAAFRKALGS